MIGSNGFPVVARRGTRPTSMVRRTGAVAVGAVLIWVTGCSSGRDGERQASPPVAVTDQTPAPGGSTDSTDPTPAPVAIDSTTTAAPATDPPPISIPADGPVRVAAAAMVLESSEHGPELCLGMILESLPPQCGGVPIIGWDWATAPWAESAGDSTWANVYVEGSYDRAAYTFTVETLRAVDPAVDYPSPGGVDPDHMFDAPCPEPAGGWLAEAADAPPGHPTDANVYFEAQPDRGAVWLDDSIDPTPDNGIQENTGLIMVYTFTGDLARHEAELRALWPGALCVAQAKVAAVDLAAVAAEVVAVVQGPGPITLPNGSTLRVFGYSSEGDPMTGTIDIDVEFAEPAAQAWFDETFGAGVVRLSGTLRPIG